MFVRLSDDINYLLAFVKNKYLAIGWTNSIYFIFIMLHVVGIIFFFFADQRKARALEGKEANDRYRYFET